MALAGATPKYLNSIGLIPNEKFKEEDPETDVNFLMSQVIMFILTSVLDNVMAKNSYQHYFFMFIFICV